MLDANSWVIIAAAIFPMLDKKGPGAHAFEFIYFFSSFWIQFGPNSTTFLVAAEVYPAPVRAIAHGVSAATGKLGALAATVLYNYIGSRTKLFDLQEQERYWTFVREGRENEHHGTAIHPRRLSLYERWVLKRDRNYNSKIDREDRIVEMRQLYVENLEKSGAEEVRKMSDETLTEDAEA